MNFNWAGIDYGSRKGGTTALCLARDNTLHLLQCGEKEDADQWIRQQVLDLEINRIFIDAPLSLPSIYTGGGSDYFYRECDRLTGAMSPMFIGGLTARAMQLDDALTGVELIETYPGYLARHILGLGHLYSKRRKYNKEMHQALSRYLPVKYDTLPGNWHQLDACLAWYSGWRQMKGEAISLGEPNEGLIVV